MARLPYNATQFLVSPPHWGPDCDSVVPEFVAKCFPTIHEQFHRFTHKRVVCKFALSSVVWHAQQSHFSEELERQWQHHVQVPVFTRCQHVDLPNVIMTHEDNAYMRLTGTDRLITMMTVELQASIAGRPYRHSLFLITIVCSC